MQERSSSNAVLLFLTSRGAAGQYRQGVQGVVHSGGEARHHRRSGADLSQKAADPLSRLFPQAPDPLRGLLEEVGHRGSPASTQASVQISVVNVDGKQDGVQA